MATSAASPHSQLRYDPVQLLGIVVETGQDRSCLVRCEGRDWRVERAASCLLAPQAGDEVLICGPVPEQVYLIAVVRQADPDTARVELDGDIHLASLKGGISLRSAQDLELGCPRGLSLTSESFDLRTQRGQLTIDELNYLGRQAHVAVARTSWVGSLCELAIDRLTQVAHSVLRLVRDTEQVRAGCLDYEAQQAARIHGANALITAKHLLKVDADQIHMG